jgi:hypothetical protein
MYTHASIIAVNFRIGYSQTIQMFQRYVWPEKKNKFNTFNNI